MQYFFTSDQHYGHKNIIKYCNRPFSCLQEMDEILIQNHNEIVKNEDIIIQAGDFAFVNSRHKAEEYFKRLKGRHFYLKGSHDKWMPKFTLQIWEKTIQKQFIVVCHYCIKTWERSHYNSWHLYGHSHGGLKPVGKSWDIGVDNNNFYPVSFEQIVEIMKSRPDNFNLRKEQK